LDNQRSVGISHGSLSVQTFAELSIHLAFVVGFSVCPYGEEHEGTGLLFSERDGCQASWVLDAKKHFRSTPKRLSIARDQHHTLALRQSQIPFDPLRDSSQA
jgi:hypothetical protein